MTAFQQQALPAPLSVAERIWQRIDAGGEKIWTFHDFMEWPVTAVSQALSRLARRGLVQRVGKGLYYRPRPTPFGASRPHPSLVRKLLPPAKPIFPAGISAANFLGFTTQNSARGEICTTATSLPRTFIGRDTLVHTRRPATWNQLSETDAALLDFLRQRASASELSPAETVRRLLKYLREEGRFERLAAIAAAEPSRVRALLGAFGQQLGKEPQLLATLRASLNPLSRFDFGMLAVLIHAHEWQAQKEPSARATV